jgi:hypothetical protein
MNVPPDSGDGFDWLHEVERKQWMTRPLHEPPKDYALELRRELIHGPTPWWRRCWRWMRRWWDELAQWD